MSKSLTSGSIGKNLLSFSLPFMLSSFLQTFYGLADLFIAGQFNGASTITAVSVGSQIMHMITVILIGLVMGTTVLIGRSFGAKDMARIKKVIASSIYIFIFIALIINLAVYILTPEILSLLSTPDEALNATASYLRICTGGIVFIAFYNIVSAVYRGIGDSRTPMYFVAFSGIINIALDYIFMGPLKMGARGAALATVASQIFCAVSSLIYSYRKLECFHLSGEESALDFKCIKNLLGIGFPVACQDGFIQISFLIITMIANMRGVTMAASVGITEKLISFMFLVPSSMLNSVSAIASQSAGAGDHERAKKTLFYAMLTCTASGLFFTVVCEIWAEKIIGIFSPQDNQVAFYGAQYLRSYVLDCIAAGFQFCFSGYFCAFEKSIYSFIHNVVSIILVRIPGAYLAFRLFPETLFPMGMAAPAGSLLSSFICLGFFLHLEATLKKTNGNLS